MRGCSGTSWPRLHSHGDMVGAAMVCLKAMISFPNRRQKAFFWGNTADAALAVLVKLPIAVILGFVLLAVVTTIAGLPGAELAGNGLLNALAMVAFVQGNALGIVILFAMVCFISSLWRSRAAVWRSAADLFHRTRELMQAWRAVWTHAPTAPRLTGIVVVEDKHASPVREIAGAFTPGLTPQLE